MLKEVESVVLVIAFDLDAEKPVEFAQISNLYMLGNLDLEVGNQRD